MDTRTLQFIQAVIGTDGARALAKAAAKSDDLEWALLPRVIMAWLGVVEHVSYDAELPGVADTKLALNKSERGLYGHVNIGHDVYAFNDATLEHVAASIAVALGLDPRHAPELRSPHFAKLGKSIDVLVKSRVLRAAKEELEKTSWNVKARRRYQFDPGATQPKLYPNGKPMPLTAAQVEDRRRAYVRTLGLDPRYGVGGEFPNANGTNQLAYDNTFDPSHEASHAMMTPDHQNLGEYQQWLTDRANKPPESVSDDEDGWGDEDAQRDYEEGADHENVANTMETYVDRRAGVDPHAFQSEYRSNYKGSDDAESLPYDPKSGSVPSNPAASMHQRYSGTAQMPFGHQDIRDAAKDHIKQFDQGKRFNETGHVTYPTGPDAAINARAAQKPGRWATPVKAGFTEREVNAQHNATVKAELKTAGGARGVKLPGQAAAPRAPQGPQGPVQTQPTNTGAQMTNGAAGSRIQLPGTKPKRPAMKVTKSESAHRCAACGGSQFKADRYVGCVCFAELAKNTTTVTTAEGYRLEFGSKWDAEAIAALADNLGK